MSSASKTAIKRLYREMLSDAAQFQSYNYRSYAMRRVREEFRRNAGLTPGSAEQSAALNAAREQAGVLHRQVAITKLYPPQTRSILDRA